MAALRHHDYRIFWVGTMIAGIGTWAQIFAIGWMLADIAVQEGQPQQASLYLGLLGLANAVPSLLLTPVAGAVADRNDQRLILLAANLGITLVSVAFAVLAVTGNASVLGLVVLYGTLSAVRSFDLPVRWTAVARMVPPEDLVSAIGMQAASFNLPQVLGPALGGALIVVVGAGALLSLAAATCFVAVVALLLIQPIPPVLGKPTVSVLRDVRDGLVFILRHPLVRMTVVVTMGVAFLARPSTQLLPAYAVTALHGGATELSWLLSSTGLGGLVGALMVASMGSVRRRGRAFFITAVLAGVTVALLGLQSTTIPAVIMSFAFGAAAMLFSGLSNTVFQLLSPASLRGRVIAVYTVIFVGFIPLGVLTLGTIGSWIGPDTTFVLGGVILLATTAYVFLRSPGLRALTTDGYDADAEAQAGAVAS